MAAIAPFPPHRLLSNPLTRLRQKGRLCVMILMLNIFNTFCEGSLVTSLGSKSSRTRLSGGAWGAFSLDLGILFFLELRADEKRGMGQCRSIANESGELSSSYPENLKKRVLQQCLQKLQDQK